MIEVRALVECYHGRRVVVPGEVLLVTATEAADALATARFELVRENERDVIRDAVRQHEQRYFEKSWRDRSRLRVA